MARKSKPIKTTGRVNMKELVGKIANAGLLIKPPKKKSVPKKGN